MERLKPEEILKAEWQKVTGFPFDELVKLHINYAFLAMQEYADQEVKLAVEEKDKEIERLKNLLIKSAAQIESNSAYLNHLMNRNNCHNH